MSWFLWAAMLVFGVVLWRISPRVSRADEFFGGRDGHGRDVGMGLLIATVVISWIFAKSITNAANLGRSWGMVGPVAYAGWYLSIPVAGVVIWWIRTRTEARSLPEFLTWRYGRAASVAFLLVILVRLMNEVWSNTAVVGTYFGATGSAPYLLAAMVFTAITLAYSLRGGLRSSILTDLLQMGLGVFLLVFVLALVIPRSGGVAPLVGSGVWTLEGGVDLLLVAMLQSLSYPFHDPVLTDRAFLTRPRTMLQGYLWAGVISIAFIVLFGLVGVHAKLAGIATDQDAPLRVAQAFGVAMMAAMTVLMMVSAGSTLDSTLSSFAKAVVQDLGGGGRPGAERTISMRVFRWIERRDAVALGRGAMVLAVVLGSIPLFMGTAIIKATTVSGTMVLGLAPAFLLFAVPGVGRWAFHLGFWPGIAIGVLHVLDRIPQSWAVGGGSYGSLLGANLIGTALVFGGFALGAVVDRATAAERRRVATATLALLLAGTGCIATVAPARAQESGFALHGQTMFRLTSRLRDLERPAAEVYNVRLLGTSQRDAFDFQVELRARQTKLRSYSPSNVWLQQGFGRWRSANGEVHVAAGLIYDQLGLFWDGAWFGNLLYLNGHKLDPDMNLELGWSHQLDEGLGWQTWLQLSPGEDGLNGSFATGPKTERLQLGVPDPEVSPLLREAVSVRARVVPVWKQGSWAVRPGLSAQRSVYDRLDGELGPAASGDQVAIGADLTVETPRVKVFAEVLHEEITGLSPDALERDYLLAGFESSLWTSRVIPHRALGVGASWQAAEYDVEDFDEWFLTARVTSRVNELVGITAEYVRWELSDRRRPELDRVELILHFYY